jgi:hypothetical protein
VGLGEPVGAHGWFCQLPCSEVGDCAEGSHCAARTTAEGEVVLSCLPDSQQCACGATAAAKGWSTPCFAPAIDDNGLVIGKCAGVWGCASGGCDAKAPQPESCNGQDDDCDGETDEEPPVSGDKTATKGLCDDGDPCTAGEACAGGKCSAGAEIGCGCQSDADCGGQNLCQGKWFCDKGALPFKCSPVPGTAPDCSGQEVGPCTAAGCDPKKGCALVAKPDGSACDADGNPCTAGDACVAGSCKPGPAVTCDDGNPCTFDACGKAGCSHIATTGGCDDGNACTAKDTCKKGVCTGTAIACDNDDGPCATSLCDPKTGECSESAAPSGSGCDDKNPCTTKDLCQGKECVGSGSLACDDGNPCTADSCDAKKGCVHPPGEGGCDDGNACTKNDSCSGGKCLGGASVCGCKSQSDCDAQQSAEPCLGAMVCNLVANPPACVPKPGAAGFCADGGPCTTVQCSGGKCTTSPKANGAPCDDGSACSGGDQCQGGKCSGSAVSCDDGNPCTADGCSLAAGVAQCQHAPIAGPCSDGNPCSAGDACSAGSCVAGAPKECGDSSSCTIDSCDPASGNCLHNAAPLQGKVCSSGLGVCGPAMCAAGVCEPQKANPCDDGNPCTDDSCVADVGCKHLANTQPCDDANPCTLGDTCAASACKGSKANPCDDANPCTDDSCAKASGCAHAANSALCDDGNACTLADSCAAGTCKGAKMKCGDDNPCTSSTCSAGVCSPAVAVVDGTPCKGKGSCNGQASCSAGNCIDPPANCPNKKGREIVPVDIPTGFAKANTLFDPVGLHEIKLTVAQEDWDAYQALVAKKQKGTTWWPAQVTFDGKDYGTTGIRPFGFGSLYANPQKPNIRIKFDALVDGQEGPDDVHSLRLKPSGQDRTWLKQILGPMIVQQIGGYGPRFGWARVWINGEAHGLYQMIEHVDKHFYKVNFANDDGNEYQRKVSCTGFNCPGGNCAALATYYVGDPGAATEVVAVGSAVKSASEATWPTELANLVDLDSLLAQYAWEAISSDVDTLAAAGQNYTLYMNQATARMEFIPTGEDLVLGYKAGWYPLWTPWGPPNTWCKNRVDDLYTRIVNTASLKAKLVATMQKAHCGLFATQAFVPMILAYKKLLWVDLTQDPKGILTATQIETAYKELIDYVQKRNIYLDTELGVCPPQ